MYILKFSCQIYRKAALNIVRDLGEDVFPEPEPEAAKADNASSPPQDNPLSVESQEPPSNDPAVEKAKADVSEEGGKDERKNLTTEERKPLKVPDTVHIHITPENLKAFVGPPVYYKDRMYGFAPPPGVSTGLGYLGNGSGAVMPIEATVSHCLEIATFTVTQSLNVEHAWKR